MCGICGIITVPGKSGADRATIEAMADRLTHRGPDGSGYHLAEGVALGHRRLSIIDVEGGHQPMYTEDGQVAIVFNGEIYNYVELTRELIEKGHTFKSACDTEVILHSYEERGADCVQSFNGMFAFALWDARTHTLVLSRDRLGEKSLFYYEADGLIVFASELKSLLACPLVPRELSIGSLDDYLAYGYVPDGECILEGIRKLPPGHTLVWRNGKSQIRQYWQPSFSESETTAEQEWMEELDRRLHEAVRIRLRSDVPLGVFLSGGIDSSAVVAMAAGLCTQPVRTFSVGFEEAEFSEVEYARMVATRYQTNHQEIIVRDRDINILPDLAYHLDEPFADPSALPTFYLCREARRGVTVCLSGDGGDEVLAGYSRYAEAIRYQKMDRYTRVGIRQACAAVAGAFPRHWPGAGLVNRIASNGADRYFAQCCKFPAPERRELLEAHPGAVTDEPWLFAPYFDNRRPLLQSLQHADQCTYLPDDILVKVDRMSMKTSLEVRVPFLDHTLIEFANRSPARFKLHDGSGKFLLKKLMEKYLPNELLYRRKRGFGLPLRKWFKTSMNDYARDMLLGSDARSDRYLSRRHVESVLADRERGRRDLSERIWTLLMFELWCRQYSI